MYKAVAMTVRDMLTSKRGDFKQEVNGTGSKRVYYMCMEFLLGRSLKTSICNLGLSSEYANVLKDYGIKYVSTVYDYPLMEAPSGFTVPRYAGVEGYDVITLNRNNNDIPWYEISTNLDKMPVLHGIFGCHWPNLLHEDKERHGEIIDNWVRYFERCRDSYGIILSRDIAFAATQSLYEEYTKISFENGKACLDFSSVPEALGREDKLYVSSKTPIAAYEGCELSVYEKRAGFINYELKPKGKRVILKTC